MEEVFESLIKNLIKAKKLTGFFYMGQDPPGAQFYGIVDHLPLMGDGAALVLFKDLQDLTCPVNVRWRRKKRLLYRFDLRRVNQKLPAKAEFFGEPRIRRGLSQIPEVHCYAVDWLRFAGKTRLQHDL